MKYQINKLPVKTTNGFKINDLELELNLPKFSMKNEFEFEGDISSLKIEKKIKEETISSKIGLEFQKYYDMEIVIPKNCVVEKPVFIHYSFDKDDALIGHLNFVFEENSSCNFIVQVDSNDSVFSHISENTISKKGSNGSITYINFLENDSTSFYAFLNDSYENSNICHTIIDLGGKTRVYNAYSNLLEKKAKNYLNTIYIGQDDEVLDFNYYLNNIGEETFNKMNVQGTLKDSSNKKFRGTIDFIKGCRKSIGEENENCILLSDTCRSRSLPQMLCGEEDVVGTHGVSSGKVDEDKLFYLMSRGYDSKEAEKLIVLGNFMSILNEIPDEDTRSSILSKIEEKFA